MNLKSLSDGTLIESTEALVKTERETLTSILYHFREIERRRLFSALGYKSLSDFAIRKLKYSEYEAYARVKAMRLLQDLPEMEEKIASGDILLSHVTLANTFFLQEQKATAREFTRAEKIEVFEKIASRPIREVERTLCVLSSLEVPVKPDSVRTVAEDRIELRFEASIETRAKIEKLKGLLAHKNPNLSLGELFDQLCDLGLKHHDPSASPKRRVVVAGSSIGGPESSDLRPLPLAAIRRKVFARANNECELCRSWFALEIDHRFPKALGGSDNASNLRVLCRSCNQRAAVEAYGQNKMDAFIN